MVYNYSDLMDEIDAVVYDNTTNDIKAEKIKQLLIDIVDSSTLHIYDTTRDYKIGAFCVHDSGGGYKAYVCTVATSGAFDAGDWEQVGV